MSDHCFALSVPLAVLALCGTAAAGPKQAHPKVSAAPVSQLPTARFGPEYSYPKAPMARVPNMTQMPNSHVVSAFALTLPGRPGRRLYTDVSGRVIGSGSPAAPGGIVWFGGSPDHSVPNSVPPVLPPLQKRKH